MVTTNAHAEVAAAADLSAADDARTAGDYERAHALYLEQAELRRDPLAQFNLALMYEHGWGRPADPATACEWHERAADGGIPYSNHRFAECLLKGIGRAADGAGAARYYRQAADLGHFSSLCDLGELYLQGNGVAKDPARSVALCAEAAERGARYAQLRLALLLLEGPEAVRDVEGGMRSLERAASIGLPEAQYRWAEQLRTHAGNDPQTQSSVRFWYESAAAQGYLPAYLPVAESYLGGSANRDAQSLPPEHLAKAYLWLSAAERRLPGTEDQARVAELLERVRAAIPAEWESSLRPKVQAHLDGLADAE